MKTERNRFSYFQSYDTFIIPENYKIGERTEFKARPFRTTREEVLDVAQFIPNRKVFKEFFEMHGIFNKTINYVNRLKSSNHIIPNIVESPFWSEQSSQYGDKIVFPLLMYFDDYESNNHLGSHKGISKYVAVY